MKLFSKVSFGFFVALLLFTQQGFAQVTLPRIVRDSMILQRDAKVNIWGWASSGEKVTVNFAGKKYTATTGRDGKWKIVLSPIKSGGPYTMRIKGRNEIILKDILMGDVWLCSGQSNMVHQMELHKETYAQDITSADYPMIRQFWIPTLADLQAPREDLPTGYWKSANPEDVRQFSVAAYFFAKTIYEKYKVPVGLINASVGGTPIEAWTSEEGLKDFEAVLDKVQKHKDTAYVNNINRAAFAANANYKEPHDKGLTEAKRWYDTGYIPKGWRNITVPGYWEDQGVRDLDGIVWYRKEIDIPVSMINRKAKVALGRIVDADQLYINGKLVGNTTYQYPQRRYNVPAGLLKPGKNVFTIRVVNNGGKGGFVPDKPYYITAGSDTVSLKGDWLYKVGAVFTPRPYVASIATLNQPTALFNAMVAPLLNYNIKGVLWYQGESNLSQPAQYGKYLEALIQDWRTQWKSNTLPFLFVQLPNYGDVQYLPSESGWAVLRHQQLKTLSVPHTGMAVAIDLGEWNDIHPDNKKDVGLRLALAAQKVAYGAKDVVYSGPLYQSAIMEGSKMIISFSHTGSGLMSMDGEDLEWFSIAGADKKFVRAQARIEGDKVVVWSERVPEPVYVRYAWADNPDGANLYNREGLPASPFTMEQ